MIRPGADNPQLLRQLGIASFEQRWPWIGGDLLVELKDLGLGKK